MMTSRLAIGAERMKMMNRNKSFLLFLFLFLFILYPPVLGAADHYIREGATGRNDGSDWENAHPQLPAMLNRGDTYYMADGIYPPYVFREPESGAQYITIKKATPQDHGTDVGWQPGYGDGVAVFSGRVGPYEGVLWFKSSYWVLDGAVGSGTAGHGFKITTDQQAQLVRLGTESIKVSHITIQHADFRHRGIDTDGDNGIYTLAASDIHLSQSYFHDIGDCAFWSGALSNSTIEYIYVDRNTSTPISHGTAVWLKSDNGQANNIIRYSIFKEIEGTTVLEIDGRGWQIYGNVFYTTDYPDNFYTSNGTVAVAGSFVAHDVVFCNNTIYGYTQKLSGLYTLGGSGHVAHNNLYIKCNRVHYIDVASYDYDALFDSQYADWNTPPAHHVQWGSGDPLVNAVQGDFRLARATQPGVVLPAPFDRDMNGNLRGADGVWDRGALEYNSGGPPPPGKKGDLNHDGRVDVVDLGILLSNWGSTSKPPADLNQDGVVDALDLGIMLSNWG